MAFQRAICQKNSRLTLGNHKDLHFVTFLLYPFPQLGFRCIKTCETNESPSQQPVSSTSLHDSLLVEKILLNLKQDTCRQLKVRAQIPLQLEFLVCPCSDGGWKVKGLASMVD
uniref:Pentatricopeptide repeat-containing protein At5g01110-like n=1 Tax=Rhizophora mucronata TaxID=61149 RepID=A0A2P2KE92_RHIMU